MTNWTQFINTFGVQDQLGPYITAPQIYVTHAVRGFFDNGGAACYFVRVGTAIRASLTLNDRATPTDRPALVVTAKEEGVTGNAITVEVQDASIVTSVAAVRAQATLSTASNGEATVTSASDAENFRPGDIVFLEQGTTSERATIASISDVTIKFATNLANSYTGGTIRIADLAPAQTKIRVADTTSIEPGTYISITQDGTTESRVVQSVEPINKFLTLTQGLTNTYTMATGDTEVNLQTLEFTLIINKPGFGAENFPTLSMDPRHSRYFSRIVNSLNADVTLADPPTPSAPPDNLPTVLAATPLAGGQDDDVTQLQTSHYRNGIDALEKVDEVSILCVPDRTDQDVQKYMIEHCEKMQDRFAVLDPQRNATLTDIKTQRGLVSSDRGYAALYYPWIIISNPVAEGRLPVPPSGHIAGIYARVDDSRGVHKAPANEAVRGVLDLERILTDDEQGPLNEEGINAIRSFLGSGIRVWGARTIAPKDRTQWRYVNVRRLLLFIEESLQEGTQFAVFEPNNRSLWGKLRRQVTEFLNRVWRDGALFGATAEEAFRVRIDEELNPPEVRALGQLIIEVILVPTTPAEFVVFRIISDTTGKSLIEE
ncbi:Phage tail sheath protein [Nitrosococcus oceani ATCC 19707]|uniref:Phage tail sheath protein n=2 Tax=Nitrosococcus oceani TaxID=1229 RepID=Q3JA06_NITOC|nr:phage tail sheath subtilisin-like domain-containing protein [Nitrosococcus oceani]ABA58340.1 Phage tail sheath protein [Nitrosococcus oceani ATCC 19707]KFI19269.1 tail protein [Nitrosococcus oceani C-27]GEM18728.1 phage tail protein [Nitrosococcus oceani]